LSVYSDHVPDHSLSDGFNETGHPLKEFYNKDAFRLAIETQNTIKPFLLIDTCDRLHDKCQIILSSGKSRSVFLEEISVSGMTIKDVPYPKDKVFSIMSDKLIQYKPSWIHDN